MFHERGTVPAILVGIVVVGFVCSYTEEEEEESNCYFQGFIFACSLHTSRTQSEYEIRVY